MSRKFRRPKTAEPTRYLLVGNCGPKIGQSGAEVAEIFADYGPVEVDIIDPAKSYVFITFLTAEASTAALKHFTEVDRSRNFIIKYTELAKAKQRMTEEALLHHTDACGVPGLELMKDFITQEEEQRLLRCIEQDSISWEMHSGRSVAHFGISFDYATRNVAFDKSTPPFPEETLTIVERIESLDNIPKLDQLTVNTYPCGIGLASHIDTHSAFTGAIIILSTGSAAIMQFRKGEEKIRLLLPRRSLLIMDNDSRYCWQHYIPPNRLEREEVDRVSFTFRQARGYPCNCEYPTYCDSQSGALPPTRLLLQKNIEEEHVHQVYDVIARHFSSTRFAIWPKVKQFLNSLDPGSTMVDIGCGNGKYFNARKDLIILGLDRSNGLLKSALDRQYPVGLSASRKSVVDVMQADGLQLPIRTNTMDAGLCIAVLHHISSVERRLMILKELVRVLQPGGRALVTVWAQEQEDFDKTISKWTRINTQDYLVPWHLPLHRVEGQIAAQSQEGVIDHDKKTVVFHRYYHLYTKGELEGLCGELEAIRIVDSFFDKSNWCVVLLKDKTE
eukprot:g1821.t1